MFRTYKPHPTDAGNITLIADWAVQYLLQCLIVELIKYERFALSLQLFRETFGPFVELFEMDILWIALGKMENFSVEFRNYF